MLNTIVPILGGDVAAATAFDSIATVTVGSGGAASLTFSSIPSTYNHLQIRGILRGSSSGTLFSGYVQVNSDTTFTNYRSHQLWGDGSTRGSQTFQSASYPGLFFSMGSANTSTSGIFGASILDILDYTNTNKYKTLRNLGGVDNNGSGEIDFNSALWMNTNAITSISLVGNGMNFAQYSHFALYGVK